MEEVSLITKAEQVVRDAHHRYDKVNDEFKKWENDHSDYSVKHPPEYQAWLERLEKVEKPLNEAYQRLNEERAAAEKANQSNVGPTAKKQRTAAIEESQLREYVAIAQELSLHKTGKLVKVPETIFDTDFRNGVCNGLFIRQDYVDVAKIIKTKLDSIESIRRVLILGSPGIGKSVFGVFLFLLAIQEKKDVAYRPLHKFTYYFTWNKIKNEYDISLDPYDGTTYEAYFDGNESGGALTFHLFTRVFLFASPRTTNYNEFVKQRCYKVYLNPWSKGECEKFAEIIQFKDKNEWQRRFDLVGGKPRFLFSLSTQFNDLVTDVNRGIPQSLDQLKDQVQLFEQKVFDDRMQHIAFSIYRNKDEPSLSYLTYSSLFVKGMMNARFNIGSAIEICTLLHTPEPDLQSWRGKVIEKFLLEHLRKCKGVLTGVRFL